MTKLVAINSIMISFFLCCILMGNCEKIKEEERLKTEKNENKSSRGLPEIFSDDFEKIESGKLIVHPVENWAIKEEDDNNVFTLSEPGKQGKVRAPTAYILIQNHDVTDFIFKGKIKSYQSPDVLNRDMVVVFHYQDPTHFYYVHFSAKSDSKHNIIAVVDGKDREKINHELAGESTARLNDNEFHTFKVSYDSKTFKISAYLDDMKEPVLTATDSTLTHGLVGVGSFDDTGCVDDVVLRGIERK